MTQRATAKSSWILQIASPIVSTTVLLINPVHASQSIWVKCGRDYIIGLNDRNKTFTLNDDFFIRDGKMQVTGRWFHGKAEFSPHKVELTFADTFQYRGTGAIVKNRIEISRIDLHYQRFVSNKIGNDAWTPERAGFNPTGLCIKIEEPSFKTRI